MILSSIKLEHEVIFVKYTAIAVPLAFQPKISILNKMVLPASNRLELLELVENELKETCSESL